MRSFKSFLSIFQVGKEWKLLNKNEDLFFLFYIPHSTWILTWLKYISRNLIYIYQQKHFFLHVLHITSSEVILGGWFSKSQREGCTIIQHLTNLCLNAFTLLFVLSFLILPWYFRIDKNTLWKFNDWESL